MGRGSPLPTGVSAVSLAAKHQKWRLKAGVPPARAPSSTHKRAQARRSIEQAPPSIRARLAGCCGIPSGKRYLLAFSLDTSSAYFSGEVSANAASRVDGVSSYGTGSANWLTVRSHILPSIRL